MRIDMDTPVSSDHPPTFWGSDAIADVLRQVGIDFVTLNPGASFRGLHDSIVNHLGNSKPQMLLCLHEEHAVAIAHGYAKVTGKPMGVIVHSNVGLMHASMAIFNAWCDRVPMIILGATGPVDSVKRRPWIDWIHTARDQGALIRHFSKWDDQPGSIEAAREALLRASFLCRTPPKGPVYICLDFALQEQPLEKMPEAIEMERFFPPSPSIVPRDIIDKAARLLRKARNPLILMGPVSRSMDSWRSRIALAEEVGAPVITDLKAPAAFPTHHHLHGPGPGLFPRAETLALLREADLVMSLNWIDLAGTLRTAWQDERIASEIIQVSVDHQAHNGWSMDHFGFPPADLFIAAEPDDIVPLLLNSLKDIPGSHPKGFSALTPCKRPPPGVGQTDKGIDIRYLECALRDALGARETCLARVPLSWKAHFWDFAHPLDFLGYDGGAGIGSGPGMVVGAALALRAHSRSVVGVLGDGDFLMGVTAIWTAVRFKLPLLIVVANNRSYFNDEVHQERVAIQRNRPVENKWIGQKIADPEIDLAAIARAQGAEGWGPIRERSVLNVVLSEAVSKLDQGCCCIVDVRISVSG